MWYPGDQDYKTMQEEIIGFKSPNPALVPLINVGLFGPVGASKSSIIQAVASCLLGEICRCAPSGSGTHSLTRKWKAYRFSHPGGRCNFQIFDSMGWEQGNWSGEDLKMVAEGFVPSGTDTSKGLLMTNRSIRFRRMPSVADRLHCVVFVIPVECVDLEEEVIAKHLEALKETVFDALEMQPLLLLTKVDEVPGVNSDASMRTIMDSAGLKKVKKDLSTVSGIPQNCIFPVQSFHNHYEVDQEIGFYTLRAVREFLRLAAQNIQDMLEAEPATEPEVDLRTPRRM
eukprot:evm.model.scf_1069.2 EVM.evm.TU.scf_1069.2   scf_1069:28333-30907(-)